MTEANTIAALLATLKEGLHNIGYQSDLIRCEYEFADILVREQPLRKIELAAFAEEPPSYRNACIGFVVSPFSTSEAIMKYRALGAPQILSLHSQENKILRWKMLAHKRPELIEVIEPAYLYNAIQNNKEGWNPQEVLRAKAIRFTNEPVQLDFFDIGLLPAIEEVVHSKLDRLLRDTLAKCKAVYNEYSLEEFDNKALFRLIFRLVAAKLLGDRQYPGDWLNSDVQKVLEEIGAFYFQEAPAQFVLQQNPAQQIAWDEIRNAFSFQNISVEALAYVYENTLVTPDIRKKQSIHATTHLLAEYVVQQLPFKELPENERLVFEPFAGHAPFLVAALSRLKSLLPTNMPTKQRHDYFVQMLSGMEIDAFACEVARYSLILADYPNPNGWQVEKADIFSSPRVQSYFSRANIVLCNPPYENLTEEERCSYSSFALPSVNKAVTALEFVLEQAPQMLGFVLPRVFLDGKMYTRVRKEVIDLYDNISIVSLPSNAFNFSSVETVLLIAHKLRQAGPVWSSSFVSRNDYEKFIYTGQTSWQQLASGDFIKAQKALDYPSIWYTPMQKIWDFLEYLPSLNTIADIHRGIEYNISLPANEATLIADNPQKNFVKGLIRVTDDFEPYFIGEFSYLNVDPQYRRRNAYQLPWKEPKVIVNAARISTDRWVLAGAIDEDGLVCYQNFLGVWPKTQVPIEVLSALLNSPVANAFLSVHRTAWHNRKETIAQIPVPVLKPSQMNLIRSLVLEYRSIRKEWHAYKQRDTEKFESHCRGILKQIDAELLKAYNLPTSLEKEMLNYFEGYRRPGPTSLTQVKPSYTKRFFTSLIRVEGINGESNGKTVDAIVVNWNPNKIVHFPITLVPEKVRERLDRDVLLVARVNVGANRAEELLFEDIELAPEFRSTDE